MKIPKRLKQVVHKDTKPLVARGLKLCEESGELAAEILKYQGYKGTPDDQDEILDHLHLEAVDVMIMAMDILVTTGAKNKKITAIMESQLTKWENNIKDKKEK
jgi:NTP pyrophosphatase (non-canonical NTP hydrolase)